MTPTLSRRMHSRFMIYVVVVSLFSGTPIQAQRDTRPTNQLLIVSADVLSPNVRPRLRVIGENLGTTMPTVKLNQTTLVVDSFSPVQVEALLPVDSSGNLAVRPGSYLLTVAVGSAAAQFDAFNVTIGAAGPVGPQGPKGDSGSMGPQGLKGDSGASGPQGAKGDTGASGPQGPAGPQGVQGLTGASGPAGNPGMQGAAGPKGETGAQGAKGDTGAQGPAGQLPSPSGYFTRFTFDGSSGDTEELNNPTASSGLGYTASPLGSALQLGPGGYIDLAGSTSLSNQKFSVDAWVRPDGTGPTDDWAGNAIVVKATSGCQHQVFLSWVPSTQKFHFGSGNGCGPDRITSQRSFPAGAFYHVTATYDGAAFRLYVDGQLEAERASVQTIDYGSTTWTIGNNPPEYRGGYPRTWNGLIDEIRFYNHAIIPGQGPAGPVGPPGPRGDAGAQGAQGIQGDRGLPGADGATGPKGDTGSPGLQGPKGDQGNPGFVTLPYTGSSTESYPSASLRIESSGGDGIAIRGDATQGSGAGIWGRGPQGVVGHSTSGPWSSGGYRGVGILGQGIVDGAVGVEGRAGSGGYGVVASGGRAPLRLQGASTSGPPSGTHEAGELFVDSDGTLYYCKTGGTPGVWANLSDVSSASFIQGTTAPQTTTSDLLHWDTPAGADTVNHVMVDMPRGGTIVISGTSHIVSDGGTAGVTLILDGNAVGMASTTTVNGSWLVLPVIYSQKVGPGKHYVSMTFRNYHGFRAQAGWRSLMVQALP